MHTDITVIGAGPGGYVAAIRAAQKGTKTILIEKNTPGGTCLNVGCIPTKALLESAEILHKIADWEGYGLIVKDAEIDYKQVLKRKKEIVNRLVSGVEYLIKKNKITLIHGEATLQTNKKIKVKCSDGTEKLIESEQIILATGSKPIEISQFPFKEPAIIDSTEALDLSEPPKELLIIGGGVIGVEFANIFNAFGSKVTIVEMTDSLIPGEDKEAGVLLTQELKDRGIAIYTNACAANYEKVNSKINVIVDASDGQKKLSVDKVLVAVGRTPVIEGLGLEQVGVNFDSKGVKVNSRMETNISGIYAIGDLIGNYQLAHVASQEGIIAVDNALGADLEMEYSAIPRCIYTNPEIAAVGMTEEEARNIYGDALKVGRFPLSYNGKALIEGVQEGFIKVLVEPKYLQPIGCIIVGPHAPEMISQGTLALALECTVEALDEIIFPHPTISEAFKEAVLDAIKLAIHC